MKNFNLKKFVKAVCILLPTLLLVDIVYDKLFKSLNLNETFALKNIFFKVAAAIVGGYFFATYKEEDTK